MKKLKSILMFLAATLLLTVIFCFNASAAEWHDRGDIQYSFDEETGVMVIRGEGAEVSSGDFGLSCEQHYTDGCLHNSEDYFKYWDYEQYENFEDYINNEWNPADVKSYYDSKKTKTLIIQEGVVSLESSAFYDFKNLEVVILPQSITEIPNGTFYNLSKLHTVALSNSTTSIGESAFYGCFALKNLFLPDSVKSIGKYAFIGCNQDGIRIPETVENVGELLFAPETFLSVYKQSGSKVELRGFARTYEITTAHGVEYYSYDKVSGEYTKLGEGSHGYSFTVNNLESGRTYYFAARAFLNADTQKVYSDYSNIISVTRNHEAPEKATDVKITPSSDCVRIDWIDNTNGAKIYKYVASTKKYVELDDVDDAHTVVIDGLKPATTYAFLVRPCEKTWVGYGYSYKWSDYTEKDVVYVTTLPEKTTGITATQSTSAIKLSWKEVPGATGYRVYGYDKVADKYTALGTVQKLNGTIKNLKAGTTYGYLVRAYKQLSDGTVVWADYSKNDVFYTSTKSEAPTFKATAGTKSFTLNWGLVPGATNYEVWYSTSANGTYKKLTTVTDTTYSKSCTTGKTYYFKVRAMKAVNGQTIKGEASTAKGVTIK